MSTVTEGQILAKFRQSSEDSLGRFGERVWSNIFRASGIYYLPLKDINNGGAPMVEGSKRIIAPDFDCAGETWTAFVDSKCKTRPVLFRKAKQLRHGIDLRNYEAYCKASAVYQKQAGIGVVELFDEDGVTWSGALLIETFKGLGHPVSGIEGTWGKSMVFWPRKMFDTLDHGLSPYELVEIYEGRCDSYRGILDQVFDRKIQGNLFA